MSKLPSTVEPDGEPAVDRAGIGGRRRQRQRQQQRERRQQPSRTAAGPIRPVAGSIAGDGRVSVSMAEPPLRAVEPSDVLDGQTLGAARLTCALLPG